MIKMSFTPNGKTQFYTPVEVSFDFPNDAGIDNYFRAFKTFLHALSFSVDNLEMEYVDYNDEEENCGEIMTEEDHLYISQSFKKDFKSEFS